MCKGPGGTRLEGVELGSQGKLPAGVCVVAGHAFVTFVHAGGSPGQAERGPIGQDRAGQPAREITQTRGYFQSGARGAVGWGCAALGGMPPQGL